MSASPTRSPAPITSAEFRAMQARDMTERVLQERVRHLAVAMGWLVYHTHDSRRSEPGFPDLVLVHADRRLLLYRELKTMRGTVTAHQRRWLDALTAAGANAAVWRPTDWLDGTVERALTPPTRRNP